MLADLPVAPAYQVTAPAFQAMTNTNQKISKTIDAFDYCLDLNTGCVLTIPSDAHGWLTSSGFFGGRAKGERDKGKYKIDVISLVKPPRFGTITRLERGDFFYKPKPGFKGKDKVEFILDAEGKKVRYFLTIIVTDEEPRGEDAQLNIKTNFASVAWIDAYRWPIKVLGSIRLSYNFIPCGSNRLDGSNDFDGLRQS